MTREQFEHVLRAVSQIAGDPDVGVFGSQSILGSYPEDALPAEATGSMEVDIFFLADPDGTKSQRVDWEIGELSDFQAEFGYYPQGVGIETAVLPEGWRSRLVIYETANTAPARALCLDPHDCILAKLVRFAEKDVEFSAAMVRADLIQLDVLSARVGTLPADEDIIERIRTWIAGMEQG